MNSVTTSLSHIGNNEAIYAYIQTEFCTSGILTRKILLWGDNIIHIIICHKVGALRSQEKISYISHTVQTF